MKPRFLTSVLLFLSAYAPLALIATAKDLDGKTWELEHRAAALSGIAFGAICVVALLLVMRNLHGQHPIRVKSVTGRASDLVNYSIPYLVQFVTADRFFEVPNFIGFALFMLMLFLLTWRTQTLFINPILALLGYGLYDVQFREGTSDRGGVFLIKGELGEGESVRILRLSQFLYLATKEPKTEEKNDRGAATADIGELEEASIDARQGNVLDH